MKKINLLATLALTTAVSSCALFKEKSMDQGRTAQASSNQKEGVVQAEQKNKMGQNRAQELTAGWPQSSTTAAAEMINKYGEPDEQTNETLIWKRNVAPFEEVKVHKVAYQSNFPLRHQNVLEHVVAYKINTDKVEDALKFNKSLVFNKSRGEVSSYAESEAMNVLALNLTDKIMKGQMGPEAARVKYGKEALNFINGHTPEITQVLSFGKQIQSADQDETITSQIRWIGDPDKAPKKEAQEEKRKK